MALGAMDDSGDLNILLVDANPADAELTVRALRRARIGNDLIRLESGAEALEFLFGAAGRDERPAANLGLILLELRLPKVDGVELLRRIKSDPRTRTVPVAMLSALSERREIARCYQLGANSYLVKPANPTQFSEVVCQAGAYWMRRNRTARRERRSECPLSRA